MKKKGSSLRCWHCKATRAHLFASVEWVRCEEEGLARMETVRCLLCGWRISRKTRSSYKALGWCSDWPRRNEGSESDL